MIALDAAHLLIAVASGVAVAAAAGSLVRPAPRLARRVRPYTVTSRTALGHGADVLPVIEGGPVLSGRTMTRLLQPLAAGAARRIGAVLDRTDEEALLLRLRQAGLLLDVAEEHRVQEHRQRQLASGAVWTVALGGVGMAVGSAPVAVLLALLGFVVGVARWRGRIDAAVARRRARMRIELYTINQLLAMHARVGGGVVQAIQRVVERGRGPVVDELHEVLRLHRGGRRIVDALEHAARVTPEPNAARTYKLLANGVEYGADLAEGLRGLSEDIRRQRTEEVKRAATKRRAAMLVPIIAVLAPVMLLFIAAPLPSIVLGGR